MKKFFVLLFLTSACSAGDRPIEQGWYLRADSRAIGHTFGDGAATDWNMRIGETDTRCMCKEGFMVRDDTPETFVVVLAPQGYSDTIGRRFKSKIDWATK